MRRNMLLVSLAITLALVLGACQRRPNPPAPAPQATTAGPTAQAALPLLAGSPTPQPASGAAAVTESAPAASTASATETGAPAAADTSAPGTLVPRAAIPLVGGGPGGAGTPAGQPGTAAETTPAAAPAQPAPGTPAGQPAGAAEITPAAAPAQPAPAAPAAGGNAASGVQCRAASAALALKANAVQVKAGREVTLTATLTNRGCATLEIIQYRVNLTAASRPTTLPPIDPPVVAHAGPLATGQSAVATFVLVPAHAGQITVISSATFQASLGAGQPVYWTGVASAPVQITVLP